MCTACDFQAAALKAAMNRLRNQGDVPAITHEINMRVYDQCESALGMKHKHGLPSSVDEALNSGDGSYKP